MYQSFILLGSLIVLLYAYSMFSSFITRWIYVILCFFLAVRIAAAEKLAPTASGNEYRGPAMPANFWVILLMLGEPQDSSGST